MGTLGTTAWRILAGTAALVDAVGVVVYLVVIDSQDTEQVTDPEILGWAAVMALPGLLAVVAIAAPPRIARWLLAAAVPPAAGIGLLAIFSVGLLFVLVAAIAAAALVCLGASAAQSTGEHAGSPGHRVPHP